MCLCVCECSLVAKCSPLPSVWYYRIPLVNKKIYKGSFVPSAINSMNKLHYLHSSALNVQCTLCVLCINYWQMLWCDDICCIDVMRCLYCIWWDQRWFSGLGWTIKLYSILNVARWACQRKKKYFQSVFALQTLYSSWSLKYKTWFWILFSLLSLLEQMGTLNSSKQFWRPRPVSPYE